MPDELRALIARVRANPGRTPFKRDRLALCDAVEALAAEQDKTDRRAIDAACLEVCRDNSAEAVGQPDPGVGRYLLLNENGDPLIDTDDPAEVVRELYRLWVRVSGKLDAAEARVRELEAVQERITHQLDEAVQELHDTIDLDVIVSHDDHRAFGALNAYRHARRIVAEEADAARQAGRWTMPDEVSLRCDYCGDGPAEEAGSLGVVCERCGVEAAGAELERQEDRWMGMDGEADDWDWTEDEEDDHA